MSQTGHKRPWKLLANARAILRGGVTRRNGDRGTQLRCPALDRWSAANVFEEQNSDIGDLQTPH
jgi:hypothetical protein